MQYDKERRTNRVLGREFDEASSTHIEYNSKHYLTANGMALTKLPESA